MDTFPPNSSAAKSEAPPAQEKEEVKRVTTEEPIRRKKSLAKRFKETFVVGDARSAFQYVVTAVLIPTAKDMLSEAFTQGADRMIYGDTRRPRGATRPTAGPTGYVTYNRMAMTSDRPPAPNLSRRARANFDFDEIVLGSRAEAEEVIERMFDLLSRYGSASVADLYELCGLSTSHTDQKWGWTNLQGSGVVRTREGFLLNVPSPDPLGV